MLPSLKTVGLPLERYVTTYSRDYKPFSERQPQVNQLKPRTEAEAAPAFISTPQTHRETWPLFHHYFYKTTNSIYGSSLQPPSCSLLPASLYPFGIPSSMSGDVGGARTTGPLLGEEEKGQLHYVFGGKEDVLEQQEAKDEPQQNIDVLYEEGVIVLSSHGPACCQDFLRSVCREAGLQHLLPLPEASHPMITFKDAENWDNSSYLRAFGPATGLTKSSFLQPTSRQCCCSAWGTDGPNRCLKMQTCLPCSSTLPPAHVQVPFYCTEPRRKLPLTEYQARYTAEWAQPKMQQSGIHHHH